MGKVVLSISVHPDDDDEQMVELYIIDVEITYNMLFSRPWIYSQNAIVLILHQCILWSKGRKVFTTYVED